MSAFATLIMTFTTHMIHFNDVFVLTKYNDVKTINYIEMVLRIIACPCLSLYLLPQCSSVLEFTVPNLLSHYNVHCSPLGQGVVRPCQVAGPGPRWFQPIPGEDGGPPGEASLPLDGASQRSAATARIGGDWRRETEGAQGQGPIGTMFGLGVPRIRGGWGP